MTRNILAMAAPVAVVLLAAIVVGCSGGGGRPGGATTFEVAQVFPANKVDQVGLRSDVRIVFSRPVDADTVSPESVRVVAEDGGAIFGSRTVSKLTPTTVSFRPNLDFEPSTLHTVIVTTDVKDADGHALSRGHTSEFMTIAPPPPMPGPELVDDLGNGLAGGRWFHRATLLPNNRILIAGGYGANSTMQTLVEVFDPEIEDSSVQPVALQQARAAHVQIRLFDGRVLLAGGETNDNPFTPIAAAEVWSHVTHTSAAVAPMQFARSFAEAVLLPDGRVLVVGGQSLDGGNFIFRDDAEVYDPNSNTWTLVAGVMDRGRSGHGVWNVPGGDVLVMGGTSAAPSAQLLDTTTGMFEPAGSFPASAHIFGSFTTLSGGRPLYMGGSGTKAFTVFDSQFGFLAGLNSMLAERAFATLHNIPGGRAVLVGGTDFSAFPALLHDTIDLFVQEDLTGRVFRVPDLRLPRPTSHHASVMDNRADLWLFGGLPTDGNAAGLRQVTAIRFSQE
jgi:hypothetical protein